MSKFLPFKYHLFRVLATLDRGELRRLGVFLQSPYFNTDPVYVDFYKILKPYHPFFSSQQLSRARLYWRLFPDATAYNDVKLRRYFSGFTKLMEKFLATETVNDKQHYQKTLLQVYRRKGLYPAYKKQVNQAISQLQAEPLKGDSYHQAIFQINHDHYFHNDSDKYEANTIFKNALLHLDYSFLILKLRYMIEKTFRANFLQYDQSILFEQAVLEASAQLKSEHFLIHLYYNIYRLITNPNKDDSLFQETKTLFFDHMNAIKVDEQQAILETLLNYLIYHNKSNYSIYGHQQLDLYQSGLEQNLFLRNGQFSDKTFMNIAVTACILKEFAFATAFIDDYQQFLPPPVKEATVQLSKAYLYFHQKDFEKANRLALITNNSPVQYALRARSLSIRCQFEFFLHDNTRADLLVVSINQFIKFLKKHKKMASSISRPYMELMDSLKTIIKLVKRRQARNIKIDKDALTIAIQEKPVLISKNWLLQKIKEL